MSQLLYDLVNKSTTKLIKASRKNTDKLAREVTEAVYSTRDPKAIDNYNQSLRDILLNVRGEKAYGSTKTTYESDLVSDSSIDVDIVDVGPVRKYSPKHKAGESKGKYISIPEATRMWENYDIENKGKRKKLTREGYRQRVLQSVKKKSLKHMKPRGKLRVHRKELYKLIKSS